LPGRARITSSADTRAPNGHGHLPNSTHTHAATVTTASAFRHAPAEAGPAVRGGLRRGLRASRAISGTRPCVGHVFVEVFVTGQWVLVDSTNNWYVATGYDPANPVIPLRGGVAGSTAETSGFYVLRMGIYSETGLVVTTLRSRCARTRRIVQKLQNRTLSYRQLECYLRQLDQCPSPELVGGGTH